MKEPPEVMTKTTYVASPQLLITAFVGFVLALGLLRLFFTYWKLRHVPGPFWARFTDIQRVLWVQTRRAHEIHEHVHEKYGPIVRFGPDMVSLADPAFIPTVYPVRPGFPKVCMELTRLDFFLF
jgi:hypothetical protein